MTLKQSYDTLLNCHSAHEAAWPHKLLCAGHELRPSQSKSHLILWWLWPVLQGLTQLTVAGHSSSSPTALRQSSGINHLQQ